jgi:hypothetical protein
MQTIEVEFEVLKALMALREAESVTYNDVIRRLLGLEQPAATKDAPAAPVDTVGSREWTTHAVAFPAGTECRATHKGALHSGRVEAGRLVVNGKGYESPSAAASAITNTSVNGRIFWECRRPGEKDWHLITELRRAT